MAVTRLISRRRSPPIHICGIFLNLVPAGIIESMARRAAIIGKFIGALLSQRLWSAASAARRAALRILPGLPEILHPLFDVAGSSDKPRCHTSSARHPLSETHKPSLPALDPGPPRSGADRGPSRLEPCDSPT